MRTRNIDVYVYAVKNGMRLKELVIYQAPTIKADSNSELKSSFTGTFVYDPEIDWLSTEIMPMVVIDGIEHPLGIYVPTTITTNRNEGIETVDIEAYDRCWLVKTTTAPLRQHFAKDSAYLTAITSLLVQSNAGLIFSTPCSDVFRNDREDWEAGTDFLTIANELLDEINYKQLWFNSEGLAMVEPEKMVDASNIVRCYDTDNINDVIKDDSSIEIDLFDAPNVFICVCQDPDNSASQLRAVVENDNASSPLSTVRREKKIYQYIKVNNIASQTALNDYAKLVCQDNMLVGELVKLNTGIIPNCGVDEIVSVVHPQISGVFRETGWEITLEAGGTMRHTLERVVGTIE